MLPNKVKSLKMKSEIIAYLQSHQYAKRADLLEYLFNIGLQVNDHMLR
jgi:hypothetical protein